MERYKVFGIIYLCFFYGFMTVLPVIKEPDHIRYYATWEFLTLFFMSVVSFAVIWNIYKNYNTRK